MRQKHNQTVEEYYYNFENQQELVTQANVCIVDHTDLLQMEQNRDASIMEEDVRQKYTAMAFILQADSSRYKNMWKDLENNLIMGDDKFPTNMQATVHMFMRWKEPHTGGNGSRQQDQRASNASNSGDNMSFHQSEAVAGRDRTTQPTVRCYCCNRMGHYAPNCNEGSTSMCFSQTFLCFAHSKRFLP